MARAIAGGVLTSVVGFGALVLARHPGLGSIGKMAALGLGINLAVVLLGFPALLLWRTRGAGPPVSPAPAPGENGPADQIREPGRSAC
jgi:uncharacterized protein